MAATDCNGYATYNDKAESCSRSPVPVAFTVVFKNVAENVPKPCVSPMRRTEDLSKESIEEKLIAAGERRKCHEEELKSKCAAIKDECMKKAQMTMQELAACHEEELKSKCAAKDERIKKAQMTVQELAEQQSKTTEEKLKQKMGSHEKLKRAHDKALLERLYAKDKHIHEVKANLHEIIEAQCKMAEEKILQKEARSKENLEAQQKALEELKQAREHKMKEVQNAREVLELQEQEELAAKHQQKMKMKFEKRESQLRALQERLHNKGVHIEQARQTLLHNHEVQSKMYEKKLNEKMEKCEENRKAKMQAMQERLVAHDKHVEEVQRIAKMQREEGGARQG